MTDMPRAPGFDHTLALLREGYEFIGNRCDRLGTDIFRARLLLKPAICVRGADAAAFFYDDERFTRVGAMPITVVKLLQDFGSVQTLHGPMHRQRKRMFTTLASRDAALTLASQFQREWHRRIPKWVQDGELVLFDEVNLLLTRSVLAWAGLEPDAHDAEARAYEFVQMIENTGRVGPRHWWAQIVRSRSERWARGVIRAVRRGDLAVPHGALAQIARHQDADGKLLDDKTAGVELLNVLRPTVAIGRFIVFAALALHRHPDMALQIAGGDDTVVDFFVQEVRRTAPFFPFIGGIATRDLTWRGHAIAKDSWVLLDIYGTNRDSGAWIDAATFRPARFADRRPTPYDLVPQGAGDAAQTHRCPGEWLTIELMKAAVRLLVTTLRYEIDPDGEKVSLSRIPALPRGGLRLRNVRAEVQAAPAPL